MNDIINHYEQDNHNHSAGIGLDWLPQPHQAHNSPAIPRTLPQGHNPLGNTGQAARGSQDGRRGQKTGQAQDVTPIIGTDTENGITTTITGHKEGDVLVIDKASQTRPDPPLTATEVEYRKRESQ